jgi:hypothetical protein
MTRSSLGSIHGSVNPGEPGAWGLLGSWRRKAEHGGQPPADPTKLVEASNEGYPAPPSKASDLNAVIKPVIEAERGAIEAYNKLVHSHKSHRAAARRSSERIGREKWIPLQVKPVLSSPRRTVLILERGRMKESSP